jgi:hypothetical protein
MEQSESGPKPKTTEYLIVEDLCEELGFQFELLPQQTQFPGITEFRPVLDTTTSIEQLATELEQRLNLNTESGYLITVERMLENTDQPYIKIEKIITE